jgi:hypothetical protein
MHPNLFFSMALALALGGTTLAGQLEPEPALPTIQVFSRNSMTAITLSCVRRHDHSSKALLSCAVLELTLIPPNKLQNSYPPPSGISVQERKQAAQENKEEETSCGLYAVVWDRTVFKKLGWASWSVRDLEPGICKLVYEFRLDGRPGRPWTGNPEGTNWRLTRTLVGIGPPKADPVCGEAYKLLDKPEVYDSSNAGGSSSITGATKLPCASVSLVNNVDGSFILPY